MLKGRYLPTGGATLLFALTTLLLTLCNLKILILSEGRSFKRGRKEVSLKVLKWSALSNWKEGVKKIVSTWGVLLRANREESAEVHPLKNCRWKITTFNFLLQKRTSFLLHIHDNGMVKTSDHLQGTWFYSNYHLTWSVEHADRRVYYTAELLWNGEKSKLVKGIIYEERKRRRFFLPAYFFRKILGSFEGRVSVA